MKFIKKTSGLGEVLGRAINNALAKYDKAIWLVPGGSNIPISVEASKIIDEKLSKKLTILQTDERYVVLGSPDNNWHQLKKRGFDAKKAKTYPIIINNDESIDDVSKRYSKIFNHEFSSAGFIIGQFGVGPDGHIAGIKPNSLALRSSTFATGYGAEDFKRITMTFSAIRLVNQAFVFVYGESKRDVLDMLAEDSSPPLGEMPSAILKELQDCKIYNDYIEKS